VAESLSIAPDQLHRRYEEEREKRMTTGVRDYIDMVDIADSDFDRDPYAEPIVRDPLVEETDVVIVGAGWSGLTAACHLTDQGVTSYRIIDKAGDFGGTWYWNRYPGCQCDVEAYTYLPLLERTGYMPRQKYATAPEIFAYAQLLGRTWDVYPHALFQTSVTGMVWNEERKRWRVTTTRDDVIDARFVVICGGVLHVAKLPGIPGVYDFAGPAFHTARWAYDVTGGGPEAPMDKLADKVVGIIGTGATAVQAVPKLAEAAKQLIVFQRTASTVSPRNQRPTDPAWFEKMTAEPGWHERRMQNFIEGTTGAQPQVDLIQDGWTAMYHIDPKNPPRDAEEARRFEEWDDLQMAKVRQRVADTVEDQATAEKLMPWYKISCKRPCFHDEYLPAFNRDNVTLVDTDGKGVDRITPNGVVVGDTEYPVDVLIYSTGFDNTSPYHHRLGFDPVGKGGQSLSDAWAHGMYSLHGILSDGFPNMCMNQALQGGQHINIAYASTKTSEHIAWLVARCLEQGVTVEADRDAEEDWFAWVLNSALAYAAYFTNCTPGYLSNEGHQVDERGSRNAPYMGSAVDYKNRLEEWRADGSFAGVTRSAF
jgi:cation diffusion facilitator CzcD-associated flavoprotein CzcO